MASLECPAAVITRCNASETCQQIVLKINFKKHIISQIKYKYTRLTESKVQHNYEFKSKTRTLKTLHARVRKFVVTYRGVYLPELILQIIN